MAVPAANGDIYLMTIAGQMDTQTILNTYHYRLDNISGGEVTTKQVCDHLHTQLGVADGSGKRFDTAMLGLLPPQYSWVQTWIQCISPIRVAKEIYSESGFSGTWAADGHWANSAAVITRRGQLAGRKYIGSVHLPIPSELDAAGGMVPNAYLNQMLVFAIQMQYTRDKAGTPSFNLKPVLYHKGGTPNYSDIATTVCQPTVRVMRRRTVGVGI